LVNSRNLKITQQTDREHHLPSKAPWSFGLPKALEFSRFFHPEGLKTDQNILPDLPEKIDLASTTNLTKEPLGF